MKFSLITPTHSFKNLPFLLELYASIKDQTYTDWEWILILNGELQPYDIPNFLYENTKVKVYKIENNKNIGFLKNQAGKFATGDVIVEVDHDDLITFDCLDELHKAYQDKDIGFVFSNDAIYQANGEFIPYNPAYGWKYKKVNWGNKELFVMDSFEPTSHSLSFIWYSPDHVRSWKKEVYDSLGGFNPEMNVCEDHELMVRTYLKTRFKKIEKPLYIYRVTGDNTSINHRNAEIQIKTKEIFNDYAYDLAERDAKLNNLKMVDLGGGINARPGYITIDIADADIVHDLNKGIPLPDNSVGVLNASHILEHLKDPIKSMSEIYRVLVHGGWAFIEVPSTDGRGAFQDPTHISFWNENSFMYYTDKNLAKYIRNDKIRFCVYRCETFFPNEWMKSINSCVTVAWLYAIKNNEIRLPGLWNI